MRFAKEALIGRFVNLFHVNLFHFQRGGLSEVQGLSEGAVAVGC
jgi:hypothetical protein